MDMGDDDRSPASLQTDAAHERRRSLHGLAVLLSLIGIAHVSILVTQPIEQLSGDEMHYVSWAKRDVHGGKTSLLPGRLRFEDRPQLTSRVYAQLIDVDTKNPDILRRALWLQVILLLITVAAVHVQARFLGLSPRGALLATGLFGSFPWFGFYAHALWPEILHAFLFGLGLTALLAFARRGQSLVLVPAGLLFGYALFAKGVLNLFLPVVVLFIAVVAWSHRPGEPRLRRAAHVLGGCSSFLVALLVVLVPQFVANQRAGRGLRLAANRWWNLELGLVAQHEADDERLRKPEYHVRKAYLDAADGPVRRERLSRERTLAYLRSTGPVEVFVTQCKKLGRMILLDPSFLDQSLTGRRRWGRSPPPWVRILQALARIEWYGIWLLGFLGIAWTWSRKSAGWMLLTVFTAYYALALLAIPLKTRFAMPLVPVLCLFAAAALEEAGHRLRRARNRRREAVVQSPV